MTCGRRAMVLGTFVLASLSVFVGAALPAKTYPDATGTYQLARFPIVTIGSTLTFSIQRSLLGGARWFTFTVAAARESAEESGDGAFDVVPARGTLRYVLTA